MTPESGTSRHIVNSIVQLINDNIIDCSNMVAVGSDDTAVNTDAKGGAITNLELM